MSSKPDLDKLTQEVKGLAKQYGAVLVGVASIDRFDPISPMLDRPPRGHHPRDFVPDAKSVISIAQPVLNPVMDVAALADMDLEMVPLDVRYPYLEQLYNVTGHRVQDYMLEQIGQAVGQNLLLRGFDTMFFPTAGIHPAADPPLELTERQIWEGPSKRWAELHSPFGYPFAPFSHRHAAARAGLGEFGYHNVMLTREFGSRQRFNSIITEAELVPDPLISQRICLRDQCLLCIQACPMGAITMRDDQSIRDYRSVDVVDRDQVFIDTPAKTDPQLCTRRRERASNSSNRCFYGDCIRICPVPRAPVRQSQRLKQIRSR